MFTKQNLFKQKTLFPEVSVDISIAKSLSTDELEQISELYSKWLIKDPCSHCACFGGVQYARDPSWIQEQVSTPGARMALAKRYDEVVGFAQFFVDSKYFPAFAGDLAEKFQSKGKVAYIYLILIKQESYRQGLGKKLYQQVFEECTKNYCDALLAEIFVCPVPNSSSLRFHEALGFEYSGESTSHLRQIGDKSVTLSYAQLFKNLDRPLPRLQKTLVFE